MNFWKNGHWAKDDQIINGRYMFHETKGKYLIELDVEPAYDRYGASLNDDLKTVRARCALTK